MQKNRSSKKFEETLNFLETISSEDMLANVSEALELLCPQVPDYKIEDVVSVIGLFGEASIESDLDYIRFMESIKDKFVSGHLSSVYLIDLNNPYLLDFESEIFNKFFELIKEESVKEKKKISKPEKYSLITLLSEEQVQQHYQHHSPYIEPMYVLSHHKNAYDKLRQSVQRERDRFIKDLECSYPGKLVDNKVNLKSLFVFLVQFIDERSIKDGRFYSYILSKYIKTILKLYPILSKIRSTEVVKRAITSITVSSNPKLQFAPRLVQDPKNKIEKIRAIYYQKINNAMQVFAQKVADNGIYTASRSMLLENEDVKDLCSQLNLELKKADSKPVKDFLNINELFRNWETGEKLYPTSTVPSKARTLVSDKLESK